LAALAPDLLAPPLVALLNSLVAFVTFLAALFADLVVDSTAFPDDLVILPPNLSNAASVTISNGVLNNL
jgi:hypothetical protein